MTRQTRGRRKRRHTTAVEETVTPIQSVDQPGQLSVEHSAIDGIRVVTVRGEIDHTVKDVLSEALLSPDSATPPRTVVDLSGVTFMDSSGISVFISAYQARSDAQGWLRIAGAQESVLRILQIVGMDTLISCHPTVQQALHTT
ncbi:STAS domain-containing protein [Streptomyces sp. NPDC048484]|uniref:STAS domain-containing protein n=1 Tax=Streptomyces sp. NPDC048484 TaxID=3155146 RepID=UPI00342C8373